MYILMAAHIGETLGHLARGLAIADELTANGSRVEFACSEKASWLLKGWKRRYVHHTVRWPFSHNGCNPIKPSTAFLGVVREMNADVLALLKRLQPDLVIGLPGIFTTQAARSVGIPHVSILHGPYLSPIDYFDNLSITEAAVLQFSRSIFSGGCIDAIYEELHRSLSLPNLTYDELLKTEQIFVPQPGMRLPHRGNIHVVGFIRASFGPPCELDPTVLGNSCYVTFGSGNPCDISRIIELCRNVFPTVLVSTGQNTLREVPSGAVARPFIASSSLAGRIPVVVSHGGIGTVGTFVEYATRQIIIPTELDQATMAIHAARLGIAQHCGLDAWASVPMLGRQLPKFEEEEFVALLTQLKSKPSTSAGFECSGASQIAQTLSPHNFNIEFRSLAVVSGDPAY